jgi:hypothetical protein
VTANGGPEPSPGWFRLQGRDPPQRYSAKVFVTLGLFCSIGCVAAGTANTADRAANG